MSAFFDLERAKVSLLWIIPLTGGESLRCFESWAPPKHLSGLELVGALLANLQALRRHSARRHPIFDGFVVFGVTRQVVILLLIFDGFVVLVVEFDVETLFGPLLARGPRRLRRSHDRGPAAGSCRIESPTSVWATAWAAPLQSAFGRSITTPPTRFSHFRPDSRIIFTTPLSVSRHLTDPQRPPAASSCCFPPPGLTCAWVCEASLSNAVRGLLSTFAQACIFEALTLPASFGKAGLLQRHFSHLRRYEQF